MSAKCQSLTAQRVIEFVCLVPLVELKVAAQPELCWIAQRGQVGVTDITAGGAERRRKMFSAESGLKK
jgi:hypothetical protein